MKDEDYDILIKDEGYADIKFISDKAKQWAFDNGLPNYLDYFGDTWRGHPIWKNETKKGFYKCNVDQKNVTDLVKEFKEANLTVNSEIS